jgi:hypothetical protein
LIIGKHSSMKTAIMQPYFFPYIGYFQLINSVDIFVIYDKIQYTKKGWINRNRILLNKKESMITLPIKKDSDFLNVNERFLSDNWLIESIKILNLVREAYRKAPYFDMVYPIINECINYDSRNLFKFIFNSINLIIDYLEIETQIILSSSININHELKAEDKVISICNELETSIYINPIGGLELYSKDKFMENGLDLFFLKTNDLVYQQCNNSTFISNLSIIDVLMNNSKEKVKEMLDKYTIL